MPDFNWLIRGRHPAILSFTFICRSLIGLHEGNIPMAVQINQKRSCKGTRYYRQCSDLSIECKSKTYIICIYCIVFLICVTL